MSRFVATRALLLSAAMGLRREAKDRTTYRRRARRLMARIKAVIGRSANHPAVQTHQSIFRDALDRIAAATSPPPDIGAMLFPPKPPLPSAVRAA